MLCRWYPSMPYSRGCAIPACLAAGRCLLPGGVCCRGAAWWTPPRRPLLRAVRILLEWILLFYMATSQPGSYLCHLCEIDVTLTAVWVSLSIPGRCLVLVLFFWWSRWPSYFSFAGTILRQMDSRFPCKRTRIISLIHSWQCWYFCIA